MLCKIACVRAAAGPDWDRTRRSVAEFDRCRDNPRSYATAVSLPYDAFQLSHESGLNAEMTNENETASTRPAESEAETAAATPAAPAPAGQSSKPKEATARQRKKIRVKTRKRKGKTRVWKSRWVRAGKPGS
jgi:hypothetical protein